MGLFKHYLVPLVAILGGPLAVQVLLNYPREEGWAGFKYQMLVGNLFSWSLLTAWLAWLALFVRIPFDRYLGRATSFGHRPEYNNNGLPLFITNLFVGLGMEGMFPGITVAMHDNFPYMLGTLNVVGFALSIYLLWASKNCPTAPKDPYLKEAPSSWLYRFYAGMELHPAIFGMDVKQWVAARAGYMTWEAMVLFFALASYFKNGFDVGIIVNFLLQVWYLKKFYENESVFLSGLSITYDRAGFYLIWGSLNVIPALYGFLAYYYVDHLPDLSYLEALLITCLGLFFITLRFRIDEQKDKFREAEGNVSIDGKKASFIEAQYETLQGPQKALLLTSGFWGTTRHINYLFEVLVMVAWSLVAIHLEPRALSFASAIFVAVVLLHRLFRDERKCATKYGDSWKQYCKAAKYRLIPYLF